jgi:hypothetical protein
VLLGLKVQLEVPVQLVPKVLLGLKVLPVQLVQLVLKVSLVLKVLQVVLEVLEVLEVPEVQEVQEVVEILEEVLYYIQQQLLYHSVQMVVGFLHLRYQVVNSVLHMTHF